MNELITVGRSTDSDIIIDDNTVSRKHLTIGFSNNHLDKYLVHDYSKYGTMLNDLQILQTETDLIGDKIKLGKYQLNKEEILNIVTKLKVKNNIYVDDFKQILDKVKSYDKEKSDLNNATKFVIKKSLITLVLLSIIATLPLGEEDPYHLKTILMIVGGPLIFTLLDKSPQKKQEELENLKIKYEDVLKCPKCGLTLMSNSYNYWKMKKICPNGKCNAIWSL
jgi:pSer/pThr/pTyr-binding forkhead associated (FHA) protein